MDEKEWQRLPDDLLDVVDRLRAHRPEVSPLELDQIKLRAMAGAERHSATRFGKGQFMRSKLVTLLLVLGLAASGGAAGVVAGGHDGDHQGSGGSGEYKPGKGCGDKNHTHTGPPGNPDNTDCPNH